jgi:hypothetical protein
MLVYTDASQANNEDLSSQVGYIIILTDHSKQTSIVHYQPHKSQRVTRSSMAGETLDFADGFDKEFILRHYLEDMLGQPVPLVMYTDSQALFNVLTRNKTTTERRLMVDVAAVRHVYHNSIISNIGLIKSCYNPADGLTKVGCNHALANLLRTHSIDHRSNSTCYEIVKRKKLVGRHVEDC